MRNCLNLNKKRKISQTNRMGKSNRKKRSNYQYKLLKMKRNQILKQNHSLLRLRPLLLKVAKWNKK